VAGLIGLLSGLTELIGAFGNETWRALRTFGGWLLLGVNFLGAALIFLLVAGVAPGAQTIWAAIVVGLAWPTVVRNLSIKLGQPLEADANQQSAALRLEQAYATIQKLSKQMIDGDIVRQRMRLLRELTAMDLQELERLARMAVILSKQADPREALAFIDQIMEQREQREVKKAMLAANILNNFGRDTLEDIMAQLRKGQLPALKEPPKSAPKEPPKEPDPTI
jgi:hypothetical protein